MSVRRLAEESVQPDSFKFSRAMAAEAKKWIGKYPKGREQSAVIPLLMLAQEQDGWVTRAAIEHISQTLDMPRIRVMEVATFYTQFMLQPVGRKAHVQVCGTTPCMLRGAEDLKKVCQNRIHHDPFALSADGALSWEEVECQGACVNAPMVMIGKDTYEDLTPERLEEIIDAFEAGKGDTITPGPQVDRVFSAPAGGPTTLLEDPAGPSESTHTPNGKANGEQEMTKAAKPKTAAPEGAPAFADPDEAEGPGRKKASKTQVDAKTEDAGPTLKVASTASSVRPKETGGATVESGNPTMKVAATASGRARAASKERVAAAAPASDDTNRPAGIERPAQPDDLKRISGVGPKIEGILHSLGIYTFEQIAGWNAAEREWVDGYLRFKGRIERDNWVDQARTLAGENG
ncbi:NADH-quinone oxidoreductase subunit E [Oricola cellulosilytica]|uniref:NADH-quinone oxidoreductase subunit E n=1 Tax=Oricola cellulosilytica TaxID=1429082 RepID=A0A4R0PB20_9HYPH|nr:NADH-quinone oxidoreductase subunit E [Oricola cellulosilytica]TCD14441.1 NADH-quinone oxidoreductase subunit E [Oricola cellulosilytica]